MQGLGYDTHTVQFVNTACRCALLLTAESAAAGSPKCAADLLRSHCRRSAWQDLLHRCACPSETVSTTLQLTRVSRRPSLLNQFVADPVGRARLARLLRWLHLSGRGCDDSGSDCAGDVNGRGDERGGSVVRRCRRDDPHLCHVRSSSLRMISPLTVCLAQCRLHRRHHPRHALDQVRQACWNCLAQAHPPNAVS